MIAFAFYGFAAAPETRKRVMMITGIAAVIAALTGVRMWQGLYTFALFTWVFVKIAAWIGLAALAGIGYRQRARTGLFMSIILVLAVVALVAVYWRPITT